MRRDFPDGDGIFQQEIAPCHTSRKMRTFFEESGLEVLDWPGNSPDINPIENLWVIMKRRLQKEDCSTMTKLISAGIRAWYHDEELAKMCSNLVESMPNRVQMLVKAKGGHIKEVISPINYIIFCTIDIAISGDHFSAFSMYAWSKLALILFAYALHQKINKTSNSSKIRVICLHPGIVDTKLYQHVWFAKLFPVLLKMFFLTKEQGATNVLQAIYSAETENDHCFYWSDGMVTKSSPLSYDPVMQNELWKQTISTLSSWLVPKLKREFSLDG
ncbi:Transposable element Tc1 transposase [Nymphon striatum]|nr:Transposable element Tc1 transposase [Nymphon striatum]